MQQAPSFPRELSATARLAFPLILGQLSATAMNVVITLLAGHLDAQTLGAVAVGTSIWTLALVATIGVMMALPPSVAQLQGAGRRDQLAALFHQAVWLAVGLGLCLFLALRFAGPLLLHAIGLEPELTDGGTAFLHGVSWGAPALALFFACRGLSEGMGLTRPTMYFGGLGLAFLLPLGWVLMHGKLGIPSLGARGAGLAIACVLWIQLGAFSLYLARRHHYADLQLTRGWSGPNRKQIGMLLHIGLPMGITVFMEASLFVAVALVIGRLGADIVSSHQIAINVASVAFMVPLGLAMATTVRVGHAVGREDWHGVRRVAGAGFTLTMLTQCVSASALLLGSQHIARLYTSNPDVIALTAQLLVLGAIFQISDGIQVAANGALRGLKDTRIPMLMTAVAYWVVGMPFGVWLTFSHDLGARGMWMGLILGLSVAAVLLPWRFLRLTRPVQGIAQDIAGPAA